MIFNWEIFLIITSWLTVVCDLEEWKILWRAEFMLETFPTV